MSKRIFTSLLMFLVVGLGAISNANAQACDDATITASLNEGCIPTTITFTVDNEPNYTTATWYWNDSSGNTTAYTRDFESFTFNFWGTFTPYVVYFDGNGDPICTLEVDRPVRIFDNPNVDFQLPPGDTQCFEDNLFCFTDRTTPGRDNAPIRSRLWAFGNGDSSTQEDPCYQYPQDGVYDIELIAVDTNGCRDIEVKTTSIVVLPVNYPAL